MNKFKDMFFKGLILGKPIYAYLDKGCFFYCNYSFSNINTKAMKFTYEKDEKNNHTYRLFHNLGEVFTLISPVKYGKEEVEILFKNLILAQRNFLKIKKETENNLGNLKLEIKI